MYLVANDFKKQIQEGNLNQVTGNDQDTLNAAMRTAQAEAISYLIQKYDVSTEFTETSPWSNTKEYKASDRITIDFPLYNPSSSYTVGNLCINGGRGYICTENTTGAFDPTKWEDLGAANTSYFVTIPYPVFDLYAQYKKGNEVFYKDKVYVCQVASNQLTHDMAIQYGTYNNLPFPNVFPDDPVAGLLAWGVGTNYTIDPGTLPTDNTKWTQADNRDQQMLTYLIDIALYHAHARIAPKNVPEKILFRYTGRIEDVAIKDGKTTFPTYCALGWLQACATGQLTPALPVKQPKQGRRIRYGGNIKNINSY